MATDSRLLMEELEEPCHRRTLFGWPFILSFAQSSSAQVNSVAIHKREIKSRRMRQQLKD